jgi:hypothetical protein
VTLQQPLTLQQLLQTEGRRFIAALERAATAKRSALFDVAELYTIADRIELQAEVPALLEDLRDAGEQCALCIPLLWRHSEESTASRWLRRSGAVRNGFSY